MKIAVNIVGALLGVAFIFFSLMILLGLAPKPELPVDSAPDHFMKAFVPTGYLTFVKVLELIGGILVAIPLTRNIGLLILGPIIINIAVFHLLVAKGGFFGMPLILGLIALFLLWAERKAFAGLVTRA